VTTTVTFEGQGALESALVFPADYPGRLPAAGRDTILVGYGRDSVEIPVAVAQ